jgi:hypothetical protein
MQNIYHVRKVLVVYVRKGNPMHLSMAKKKNRERPISTLTVRSNGRVLLLRIGKKKNATSKQQKNARVLHTTAPSSSVKKEARAKKGPPSP